MYVYFFRWRFQLFLYGKITGKDDFHDYEYFGFYSKSIWERWSKNNNLILWLLQLWCIVICSLSSILINHTSMSLILFIFVFLSFRNNLFYVITVIKIYGNYSMQNTENSISSFFIRNKSQLLSKLIF